MSFFISIFKNMYTNLLITQLICLMFIAVEPYIIPILVGYITESFALNEINLYASLSFIVVQGLGVLLIFFIGKLMSSLIPLIEINTRNVLFEKIQKLPYITLEKMDEGEIIKRILLVGETTHIFLEKFINRIFPSFCIFLVATLHFSLTNIFIGLTFCLWCITHSYLFFYAYKESSLIAKEHNDIHNNIYSFLSNSFKNQIYKYFYNIYDEEMNRLQYINDKEKQLHKESISTMYKWKFIQAIVCFLFQGIAINVLIVVLWKFSILSFSQVTTIFHMNGGIIKIVWRLVDHLPEMSQQIGRIKACLDLICNEEVLNNKNIPKNNHINVQNISFFYDKKQIIHNLSFEVHSGEKFIVKGTSGKGKSTLLKLLSGLYSPNDGSITVDNMLIENILGISFIPANKYIFNASLIYNLTFGKEYDENDFYEALNICIIDFIHNYEDNISVSNLSTGQVQRILLARSWMYMKKFNKNSEDMGISNGGILIMDEPISALDLETSEKIMKQFLCLKYTIICVDHTEVCEKILKENNMKHFILSL